MSAKSSRAMGLTDFFNKKFDLFAFEGPWLDSFGHPEKNFKMCVWGASGNGKTDFCVKLTKYLAQFGKVYYNSFEEGVSKTLQDAFVRNEMRTVTGKVIIGDREHFDEVMLRLSKRNSPHFTIIDSRDYMRLTYDQYQSLVARFPHKSFVFVCWESGSDPRSEHGKQIRYMADIKVRVRKFRAYPSSRYGGNKPFIIWDHPTVSQGNGDDQPNLFNQPAET